MVRVQNTQISKWNNCLKKITIMIKKNRYKIKVSILKLSMVGLVDNRPSTNLSKKWHLTPDTWHMTCDMWLVTYDMWHMMGAEHSLKMSAWDRQCLEDMEEKHQWGTEWIN